MSPLYLGICCLLVSVAVVKGLGAHCPTCTDKYDYDSCEGSQQCANDRDFCSLIVNTTDSYSLDYVCREYTECMRLENLKCHPDVNETCYYCCDDVVTCEIQRNDLYLYEFPPNLGQIPTASIETTTIAGPSAVTVTTSTAATALDTELTCVQCGYFPRRIPCTDMELVFHQFSRCPSTSSYCFTTFTQSGTNVSVFKGCASDDFCSLEYQLASQNADCDDPDITVAKQSSCGYCCNQDSCNASLRPDNTTLVTFP